MSKMMSSKGRKKEYSREIIKKKEGEMGGKEELMGSTKAIEQSQVDKKNAKVEKLAAKLYSVVDNFGGDLSPGIKTSLLELLGGKVKDVRNYFPESFAYRFEEFRPILSGTRPDVLDCVEELVQTCHNDEAQRTAERILEAYRFGREDGANKGEF